MKYNRLVCNDNNSIDKRGAIVLWLANWTVSSQVRVQITHQDITYIKRIQNHLHPALRTFEYRSHSPHTSVGHVWSIGRVDAFRPKGHGFDSRSSRRNLGQVLNSQLPVALWREFRHSKLSVLCRERLWVVVDLKRCYRNGLNEWRSMCIIMLTNTRAWTKF